MYMLYPRQASCRAGTCRTHLQQAAGRKQLHGRPVRVAVHQHRQCHVARLACKEVEPGLGEHGKDGTERPAQDAQADLRTASSACRVCTTLHLMGICSFHSPCCARASGACSSVNKSFACRVLSCLTITSIQDARVRHHVALVRACSRQPSRPAGYALTPILRSTAAKEKLAKSTT